jgi:malate synthase
MGPTDALTRASRLLPAGPLTDQHRSILTPEALGFVEELVRRFDGRRRELLFKRADRQAALDAGARPGFLAETRAIREADWTVAPIPEDLRCRHVELTGPPDRKMIVNALNSGADVFMADFEDATSPTWANVLDGQVNLRDAVRRTIELTAVLMVRPRGWHLPEKHLRLDGDAVPAALVDFGLYFFHNARELLARGSGPYFHLPKLESHLEARLWNDVFVAAQELLGIPRGTIRATVLIETIYAAFEMNEILWELREHSAGLDCCNRGYLFSIIKRFRNDPGFVLPDRAAVTMTTHGMRACSRLAVRTCHRRGIHAIGGMAAQNDEITAKDLLTVPEGSITEKGLRHNIEVAIRYMAAWLDGQGRVPIDHRMEDAATAEISRAQIWQWIRHACRLEDGRTITATLCRDWIREELDTLRDRLGETVFARGRFEDAARLIEDLVTRNELVEFMTAVGYDRLD